MKRIKTRRKHFRISNPLGFSLFCAMCILAVGLVVGIVCLSVGYGKDAVQCVKAQLNGTSVSQNTPVPSVEPTDTPAPTQSAIETPDVGTPVPDTPTPPPLDETTPAPDESAAPSKDPNAPLYGFTIGLDPTRDGGSKYKEEAAYNLDFAKQLGMYLESKGATVVLTREDNDKSVSNTSRAKTIKQADCDIALRLICNHISSKSTGCYVQMSKKNKSYGSALIEAYAAATGIRLQAGKKNGTETKSDSVASNCGCPCVMLVMGNWDNKSDRAILEEDSSRQAMIEAIYDTLLAQLKK